MAMVSPTQETTEKPLNPDLLLPHDLTLSISPQELNLDYTLGSGQLFRWVRVGENEWQGPIGQHFYRLLQYQEKLHIHSDSPTTDEDIRSFLRLDVSLADIKYEVGQLRPDLIPLFNLFPGLRICRQNPVECLLTFCCAVVTTIERISCSVQALSYHYGEQQSWGWSFPSLEKLATLSADELRVGAMEFRCRNLYNAVQFLYANGGVGFLEQSRSMPLSEARLHLTQIPHIGNKIADCVLLFALGHDDAFPLDTHTWRMALRMFPDLPHNRSSKGYLRASEIVVNRLGQYAGWVQQYLYLASLNRITDW